MDMNSPAIDCKLLCASVCAYYATLKGGFCPPSNSDKDKDPNYDLYVKLGIIGEVKVFTNNSPILEKIDAAIIVLTDIGYILSFRGTLPFSTKGHDIALIEDWGEDVLGSNTVEYNGLPGKVHKGFSTAFGTLWPNIIDYLKDIYVNKKSTQPLYITGHSKGGPMASYAAYLALQEGFPFTGITTFASPFPGDQTFAVIYNSKIIQTRFEYYLDIVPFLPPQTKTISKWHHEIDIILLFLIATKIINQSKYDEINKAFNALETLNYKPVGTLKYITKEFQVVSDSEGLAAKRAEQFKEIIHEDGILEGLKRIGKSHTVFCGGGYQKGTCPGACQNG